MKKWVLGLGVFVLLVIVVGVFAETFYGYKSDNFGESIGNFFSGSKSITLFAQSGLPVPSVPSANCMYIREGSYSFWNNVVYSNSPVDDSTCVNSQSYTVFRRHGTPTGCQTMPVSESIVTYAMPTAIKNSAGKVYLQTSECGGVAGYVQGTDAPFSVHLNSGTGAVKDFIVIPMCGVSNDDNGIFPFGYAGEGYAQFVNKANCGIDCIDGVTAYYIRPLFEKDTTGSYTLCW